MRSSLGSYVVLTASPLENEIACSSFDIFRFWATSFFYFSIFEWVVDLRSKFNFQIAVAQPATAAVQGKARCPFHPSIFLIVLSMVVIIELAKLLKCLKIVKVRSTSRFRKPSSA
jgi:hypothetical protein